MNLKDLFGQRVVPKQRSATVNKRRAALDFSYSVGEADTYLFTADIYAYMENIHPERHLGWWRFELPPGRGLATLEMDFGQVGKGSMHVTTAGTRIAPIDAWFNPEYAFDPIGDLKLVLRDPSGAVRRLESVLLKFVDRDILLAFYKRQYSTEGYTAAPEEPFLRELHAYKLDRLRDLFERYIPGGRVVDVGCGRSLFTELEKPFPFRVYAGDLNFTSVYERAVRVPHQVWGVFDAAALPFQDGEFDALFAGEVIEHMADVPATLREWGRVLKPGGVAIITTPNKERLVALADGLECPYSRDHLNELSYRELTRGLLPSSGFDFIEQSCLYVELRLQNLFNRHRVQDFLQREGNRVENIAAMRRLLPLGRWFPWISMALVVVARKRPS